MVSLQNIEGNVSREYGTEGNQALFFKIINESLNCNSKQVVYLIERKFVLHTVDILGYWEQVNCL